jgi:UDP:flavonoid glycosyltransferase YjiC (YdhE family)
MGERILIGCYGSGGDVFPLIPTANRLQSVGHEVLFVAPRSLGLYLRLSGLPYFGYGDGTELAAHSDQRLLSDRFGGWSSNREIVCGYLERSLDRDLEVIEKCMSEWEPSVALLTTFAAPVRIAAARHRLPIVETSIYPQYWALEQAGSHFARTYVGAVEAALPVHCSAAWSRARAGWGVGPATLLLHEPALLLTPLGSRAIGYPYWDGEPFGLGDMPRLREWFAADDSEVVAITLGSFIGRGRDGVVDRISAMVRRLGLRALIVNGGVGPHDGSPDPRECRVGFTSLSAVLPMCRLLVHHGGLGTSIAALRSGIPSMVVPQAFDQPWTGALLESAGVALVARPESLGDAARELLADEGYAIRARSIGGQLLGSEAATDRVVRAVLAAAEAPPAGNESVIV